MEEADLRFAVYLIPPYPVARAVVEVHRMLRKQFGFTAADRFQAHITLKGFFKKIPGPDAELVAGLDRLFARQQPFPVHFNGFRIDEVGIGLNVNDIDGGPNGELAVVREAIVDVVRPWIAPDCDFAAADLGNPFRGHMTLAFRDIPLVLQDDVLDYLADAPLPTEPFMARTFHYLAFHSQDWGGPWWETLTWRLLRSWVVED
jgi:2'-5' RNA ligase